MQIQKMNLVSKAVTPSETGNGPREREREESGSKPGCMHTILGDGMSVLTSSLIREKFLGFRSVNTECLG